MIAPENPPWTDVVHVVHQKIPFHGLTAVLIRAWHNMMRATCQVCLQQQTIGEKLETLRIIVEISFVYFISFYFFFDILNGCSAGVSNISVTR